MGALPSLLQMRHVSGGHMGITHKRKMRNRTRDGSLAFLVSDEEIPEAVIHLADQDGNFAAGVLMLQCVVHVPSAGMFPSSDISVRLCCGCIPLAVLYSRHPSLGMRSFKDLLHAVLPLGAEEVFPRCTLVYFQVCLSLTKRNSGSNQMSREAVIRLSASPQTYSSLGRDDRPASRIATSATPRALEPFWDSNWMALTIQLLWQQALNCGHAGEVEAHVEGKDILLSA